ncbi:hypothetical protein CK203_075467 [Vitis vinifera]|uniref:Uncharacterized protein n=1 Tax=Vitis vinifera TaxID=29760 RepID=A0A438EUE0_VITVI|nr:hypothetical protein CK203_075467 [Vitis vinifera]
MLMVVRGRGKLGYLNGTIIEPAKTDPTYLIWDTDNSIVMSWLVNSMTDEELDEIRGRLLRIKPLLAIEEIFAEVRREETHKRVMLGGEKTPIVAGHTTVDNSALAARKMTVPVKIRATTEETETFGVITIRDPITVMKNAGGCGHIKVKIANGSLATVVGTGAIILRPHITLFNDMSSRKRIGSAEKYGGLYYFKEDNTKDGQALTAGCESSSRTKQQKIMLWHFSVIFVNLPNINAPIVLLDYKASKPFAMIHSDIWGLSRL